MTIEEKLELGRVSAQAHAPDAQKNGDSDDDMILLPEDGKLLDEKEYYIDLDATLDEEKAAK